MIGTELVKVLKNNNNEEKIEYLNWLCDIFESYNKNIEEFDIIINALIEFSIVEEEVEIKERIFDTLERAALYHNLGDYNRDKIAEEVDTYSREILSSVISILAYSHNKKYVVILESLHKLNDESVASELSLKIEFDEEGSKKLISNIALCYNY